MTHDKYMNVIIIEVKLLFASLCLAPKHRHLPYWLFSSLFSRSFFISLALSICVVCVLFIFMCKCVHVFLLFQRTKNSGKIYPTVETDRKKKCKTMNEQWISNRQKLSVVYVLKESRFVLFAFRIEMIWLRKKNKTA